MNNPNDLILRTAAIEAFDDERVDRNYGDVSPESVIGVIESIPAVDATPVVHAYWLDCSEGYDGTVYRKCSACKDMQIHYYTYYPNYCPECGAKMDGERRDSE